MAADSMDKREVNRRFGTAVKDARRVAHLSQQQLALELGVPRASVSMIESGNQSVTVPTLLRISDALKISITRLVLSVEEPTLQDASESMHASRANDIRQKYLTDEE